MSSNKEVSKKIIKTILHSMAVLFDKGTPLHKLSNQEKKSTITDWVNQTEYILDTTYGEPDNDNYLQAYFDGSASPNPGLMSIGFCIKNKVGTILVEDRANLQEGTNNMAEYIALITLLKRLIPMKPKHVKIFGDSQLVINQLTGKFKVKKSELKQLVNQTKNLLSQLNEFELMWVKRAQNMEADRLSKRV